jgi:NADPH:quinone reductase-like Zn-dependent oxidoreductase
MHAAVVTAFDTPPRSASWPEPDATGPHELVVDVLAAGLHPRVRSQADGSHYTATDALPLVPGVDGVGRDASGALRYFVLGDTTLGSMAERTVIDERRSILLPPESGPVTIAAAMNPAMSSWIALRRRTTFRQGARVLVLGATGNAGRMAVQVAKHLGAGEVVAAGRDSAKLAALDHLGADARISLAREPEDVARALSDTAADVDVVLDYLWGDATATAMRGIVPARTDPGHALTWIQIGSVAGPTSPIPSAALRSTVLQIVGSGQGSVSPREIVAELPALAAAVTSRVFDVDAVAVPLADVESAWTEHRTASRTVLVP